MRAKSKLSEQFNKIILKSSYYSIIFVVLIYTLLLEIYASNYTLLSCYYEEQYALDFKKYVRENNISSQDRKEIRNWSKGKWFLDLNIFDNNKLVYSDDIEQSYVKEEGYEKNYDYILVTPGDLSIKSNYSMSINFSDGKKLTAYFTIDCYHEIKEGVLVFSVLIGILFFILIFLKNFKNEIEYINLLSGEVSLFEKNKLNNDFTIVGNNEITTLAYTLNSMKNTILEKEKREIELKKEQEKLVTGMAHDLRTPMTGLSNYVEVLKQKNSDKELDNVIERISDKLKDMEMLSEQLFEYFIVRNDSKIKAVYTEMIETSIGEYVTAVYIDLLKSGFNVNLKDFEFNGQYVMISHTLLNRIMSNILSNICKYAQKDKTIEIKSEFVDNEYRVYFRNIVSEEVLKIKGTKVGVENIKIMMRYMDGYCIDSNSDFGNKYDCIAGNEYFIMLAFKIQS
ncbi:sensor histidine kinase [Peptostreptococcus sp. D1]|uniref:sensor histidine kinase n=1 Tax=Peptostreptococcus sp. D1 TaxID=72304 RepID=UPI0008EB6CBF|nr:HAMP domain-containing sensor histidine kinase [Peptostreptococcus sp. D1]SFE93703.1 His Kinase A (phospho-acceptor) domain-containing protein [Peptostreptococcus sp. D1]